MLLREVASLLVVVSVFGCCAADPKTRKLTSPENIDNKEAISSIAAAAFSGDVAAIEQALAGGASITDQSFGARMTPLAVAASQGHADVVQWLIRRGAPVNIPDQTGTPPLSFAALSGSERAVGVLLEAGALVDDPNVVGATALHYAAAGGHQSVVELLLRAGANAKLVTVHGATAADKARAAGFVHLADSLGR